MVDISASKSHVFHMKILIGCEYSGAVRDAFISLGHDAMSCDFLPTESPGPHYQGNVFDIIGNGWDIGIFHPPCTYMASSGLHWNKKDPTRQKKTEESLEFVRMLLGCGIRHIALENPIGCISTRIRKPNQIIQPWQFGHPESKATCLWLENLPPLVPTNVLSKPIGGRWENQTPSGQNNLGPSKDRWKIRSRTYKGIADAMARQWSDFVQKNP